jgi:hypothetical protein
LKNKKPPSISVAGKIYAQLRASVSETSVSKFVDGIVLSALDDPRICDRVLEKCMAKEMRQ